MKNRRNFWDRTAIIYDRFMRRDAAAYDRMYALLRPVVRDKTVLELAAGTGLIAKHIANAAEYIEVTDASEQMIRQAERENHAENLHFSVQDMFCLPYADAAFDVVIVSHAENSFSGKGRVFLMRLAGFPLHSRWTSGEYLAFLTENGWTVRKSIVLQASFPLTYVECEKTEV